MMPRNSAVGHGTGPACSAAGLGRYAGLQKYKSDSFLGKGRAMPSEVDQLQAYTEACNNLRHYSNASLSVRTASVVQGVVLLGIWVVAISQKSPFGVALLPIIGFIFTILLYRFHMGYFEATRFFYDAAAKMEKKFFDEDCRPVASYDKRHDELYNSFSAKFFTLSAPFTLVGSVFAIAAVVSVVALSLGL